MKYKTHLGVIALLCCLSVFFCACGAGGAGGASRAFYAEAPVAAPAETSRAQAAADYERGDFSEGENLSAAPGENPEYTRKLIKNAWLRIRVDNLDAISEPLETLMKKYEAWAASTSVNENSRNYTIRVPTVSYDSLLAELESLGRLLGRTENADDVSLRYYDLESRLATKRELLQTYRAYLAKAVNIDEIMTVESRIAELQREIDDTGTQFRNLANLVDYSTISIDLAGPLAAYDYTEPTLGDKLGELFGSLGSVASSALVVLLGILVYGVPAILILVLLFWLLFGRIGLLRKLFRLASGK